MKLSDCPLVGFKINGGHRVGRLVYEHPEANVIVDERRGEVHTLSGVYFTRLPERTDDEGLPRSST